jgi:hypothetical protein
VRPSLFAFVALAATTALLAIGPASASSGGTTQRQFAPASGSAGKVSVRYTVKKFVRRGPRLIAYGTAIARYTPGTAGGETSTSTKPFRAAVKVRTRSLASAQAICPVLELDLQQLDLNLLGLVVHADRVFLTIKADSEGGLLGHLLCQLSKQGKLTAQAGRLSWVAKKSGLAATGTGFTVSLQSSASGDGLRSTAARSSAPRAIAPLAICPVLELTLGPLDANLLGLLVHLDQVHLTIDADSEGGILGSLFCSVAGGGTPPTPTP